MGHAKAAAQNRLVGVEQIVGKTQTAAKLECFPLQFLRLIESALACENRSQMRLELRVAWFSRPSVR
jgi:hypothetical protein